MSSSGFIKFAYCSSLKTNETELNSEVWRPAPMTMNSKVYIGKWETNSIY